MVRKLRGNKVMLNGVFAEYSVNFNSVTFKIKPRCRVAQKYEFVLHPEHEAFLLYDWFDDIETEIVIIDSSYFNSLNDVFRFMATHISMDKSINLDYKNTKKVSEELLRILSL